MLRTVIATAATAATLSGPTHAYAQDSSLTRAYSAAECPSCAGWDTPTRPVHLFANTYYVGTSGLASILVASPDGHVLIDGGLPSSAPAILRNIETLGFRVSDVKIIVNSHEHYDHAGGIAALQRATGARVLASDAAAATMMRGVPGADDPQHAIALPMPRVPKVETVPAGHVVTLGQLQLTMHATGGHTPGGSTWSWTSCEAERCLNFVYADSQTPISQDGFRFSDNPRALAAFRDGHALLERIACDVLITPHPGASQLWQRVKTAPDGLIDPDACKRYATAARLQLDNRLAIERR